MTGKTARERWLAGELPRDHDREDQDLFAEYDARASDADRAYAAQVRILSGLAPAGATS
jgi:hypothetical protein